MRETDIGIDLGSSTVSVYVAGHGVVIQEPAVIAYDQDTHKVQAVGNEALVYLKSMHGNNISVYPFKDGLVSDYIITEKFLKYFMQKALARSALGRKPSICVTVPVNISEVQRNAVENVAFQAGAREVTLIEEPLAAAIGAGIDIMKPNANMVVDIGASRTNFMVICGGEVQITHSVPVAGYRMDRLICEYMRERYDLVIGETVAEQIKIELGTAYRRLDNPAKEVPGREAATGLRKKVTVTSAEIAEVICDVIKTILDAFAYVLGQLNEELASDIMNRGIVLTGGSSLLDGLEHVITERFAVNTMTADDPVGVAAIGTGKYTEIMRREKRR
ncbi:MAG: rod shape-determining protein [Lachnospiraceae bacterium]